MDEVINTDAFKESGNFFFVSVEHLHVASDERLYIYLHIPAVMDEHRVWKRRVEKRNNPNS